MKVALRFSRHDLSTAILLAGFPLAYSMRFTNVPIFRDLGFSHFLLLALLFVIPRGISRLRSLMLHELVFLTWLLYAMACLLMYSFLGLPMHNASAQMLGFTQAFFLFLIFRYLDTTGAKKSNTPIVYVLSCFIGIMSVPAVLDASNYLLASYQTIGMILFISGYLVIKKMHGLMMIIAVACVLVALFINGARTELAVFLMLALATFALNFWRLTAILTPVIFAVSAFLFPSLYSSIDFENGSRSLGLLRVSQDESFLARLEINRDAITTISQKPFLGDYASYPQGYYAHNALSAWVDFGFFGLCLYLSVPVLLLFYSYSFVDQWNKRDWALVFLVVALFITILASKVYYHPLIGAVVGLVSSRYYVRAPKAQGARKVPRRVSRSATPQSSFN